MAKTDNNKDFVTFSQCSNRSIESEHDALPMLSPRNVQHEKTHMKAVTKPRFTIGKETWFSPMRNFPCLKKVDCELDENIKPVYDEGTQNENVCETLPDQNGTGEEKVILPRLNDADKKQKCLNTACIDADCIRFPEISTVSKRNGRLALNRSITDLLDPEMEILDKIKHVPKKKRKRRKKLDCGTPV